MVASSGTLAVHGKRAQVAGLQLHLDRERWPAAPAPRRHTLRGMRQGTTGPARGLFPAGSSASSCLPSASPAISSFSAGNAFVAHPWRGQLHCARPWRSAGISKSIAMALLQPGRADAEKSFYGRLADGGVRSANVCLAFSARCGGAAMDDFQTPVRLLEGRESPCVKPSSSLTPVRAWPSPTAAGSTSPRPSRWYAHAVKQVSREVRRREGGGGGLLQWATSPTELAPARGRRAARRPADHHGRGDHQPFLFLGHAIDRHGRALRQGRRGQHRRRWRGGIDQLSRQSGRAGEQRPAADPALSRHSHADDRHRRRGR